MIKDYNSELCGLVSSFTSNPYLLTVIGQTILPTFGDHNYQNYLDSFASIIDKHGAKLDSYRKNYPGYKLVFFIIDESCTYAEKSEDASEVLNLAVGESIRARLHVYFADKDFVNIVVNSNADFVVWYAPLKKSQLFFSDETPRLPESVIYDIEHIPVDCINYDCARMISVEV